MQLRENNIHHLKQDRFDVLVVGGGINGAVSAAVLAARGVKTAVIDKGDFAGFTSQESSNLAWGGIKYLETYEFPLVRKLCLSRNQLMRSYPSTVREIRFFTTIKKGFRFPPWFLYLGSLLYWCMGNGFTRLPRLFAPSSIRREEPLVDVASSNGGFEYSDAYLHDNDARFVFNFIRSAMNYGGMAANYVGADRARFVNGEWHVEAQDQITGEGFTIRAKALINACGPFADEYNQVAGLQTRHQHVFSKGIHLIVDRITEKIRDNKRVLAFFADDGRLFFVIPMGPKTCIGTTDTRVTSAHTRVTAEDRKFVLDNINARLQLDPPLSESDIVAERCGVRPLVVEKSADHQAHWLQLSRKHVLEPDQLKRHITIYGGKLTDCLNVGEEICELVKGFGVPIPYPKKQWYGEPPEQLKQEFLHQARLMALDSFTDPSSSEPLSVRFWRRYGANAFELLESIRQDPQQAELLIENAEYTRCEIALAARREMITKLEDFLRRRSKISLVVRQEHIARAPGLHEACKLLFGDQAGDRLQEYFDSQPPSEKRLMG